MSANNSVRKTVLDLIAAHRSVRAFTAQPIAPELIERLVIAGTRASTSSNMQAYTVISITNAETKQKIAKLSADQQQIHQSAAFLVFCADLHRLVLACDLHQGDSSPVGESEALLVAVIDAALVMQNVAIAAEANGLGICMIGAMRNNPAEVAELLNLPKHVIALSGMCLGHPAEDGDIKPRLPIEAILHHDRYDDDDRLAGLIEAYDQTQSKWYRDKGLHPNDPRWSWVMANRIPALAKRESVGRFLRKQGFLDPGPAHGSAAD